jgi:hypothetical protein
MTTDKRRCTATTASGRPCRSWALWGTEPPRCIAHDGSGRLKGAPKNNKNAEKHGYYSKLDGNLTDIQDIIADLARKQLQLSRLIEAELTKPGTDLDTLGRLFGLHGQNASRLGRLLRDRRALTGDAADGIAGAIAQALDELSNELGTHL